MGFIIIKTVDHIFAQAFLRVNIRIHRIQLSVFSPFYRIIIFPRIHIRFNRTIILFVFIINHAIVKQHINRLFKRSRRNIAVTSKFSERKPGTVFFQRNYYVSFLFFSGKSTFNKIFGNCPVFFACHQVAISFHSLLPACASDLLIICNKGRRFLKMYDKTDIIFIVAHAQFYCSNDDFYLIV